jgi:hypothetical protein
MAKKVGHHGSANSTPWIMDETKRKKSQADVGIGSLLDTLLPVHRRGKSKASAIISTERRREPTIPDGRLLLELARRVGSVRNYAESLQNLGIDRMSLSESDFCLDSTGNRLEQRKYAPKNLIGAIDQLKVSWTERRKSARACGPWRYRSS